MTKSEVIKLLGFPAHVQLNTGDLQGGPGFETWDYYEMTEAGIIQDVPVVFGNNNNLGRVAHDVYIVPSRVLHQDNPADFEKVWDYDKKLHYPNL